MKLRYTPEAISDLQSIKRYIASTLHNPSAANRITKMILDQSALLKRFPKSGSALSDITAHETDLRMLVCENYIVLYRIDAELISIARIFNAKQDYMRFLLKDADLEDAKHQQLQSQK